MNTRPPSSHAFIQAAKEMGARCAHSEHFVVKGLQLTLKSVDPALVAWAMKYLQPLSLPPIATENPSGCENEYGDERKTCICIYSDELIVKAAEYLATPGITTVHCNGKSASKLHCARLTADHTLYFEARAGMAWLADRVSNTLYVLYSSRSREPAQEFCRSIRTTLLSYLERTGWALYHAGAVATQRGAVMIIGDAGAGKTSLILDLVYGGAEYVSNEILIVRASSEALEALSFPLPIAIGLGTALQFPDLATLVENPDALLYPRNRFSQTRVTRTPRGERANLEDKLQLLPDELLRYFGAGTQAASKNIVGVVVPHVMKTEVAAVTRQLNHEEYGDVLSNNYIGQAENRAHPVWRESDAIFGRPEIQSATLAGLTALGAIEFKYHLKPGRQRDSHYNILMNALCLKERSQYGSAANSPLTPNVPEREISY